MTLPIVATAKTFSETLMNSMTVALLSCYDWATGPVFPFEAVRDGWHGYILHTSNTLYYDIIRYSGTVTIVVNGSTVATITTGGAQTGTVDLTAQGLTIGAVYVAEVTGTPFVRWIGETKTITYTPPPTFTNGNVLTAANLDALRTGILECQSAMAWPLPPCPIEEGSGQCAGSNDSIHVYRFSFYHVHDLLRYQYRHTAEGGYTVCTKIYMNDNLIYSHDEHAEYETWQTGTIDISGYGFTKGVVYDGLVTVELNGTTHTEKVKNKFFRLTEESSATCTPPPIWTHGGTNISAANLTRYGTIIDSIHPGAAAPTLPLFYAQPAVTKLGTHDAYIQHRPGRRWLRYVPNPGRTVSLKYGPNLQTKVDLPGNTDANFSYDLGQIASLVPGQWYTLDDVHYAQEWTTIQP